MNTPPLLPGDKYLASLLGISEEEYRWFRAEVASRVKIEPGKPQAGLDPISLIVIAATLISVGLTIAASFFKPRDSGSGLNIKSRNKQGDDINTNVRFAPRRGFDSVQDPAVLGSTIPLIYTKRTSYSAQTASSDVPARPAGNYGGVRINTPLIWSQLWSINGSQLLRAMFLLGEGTIDAIDTNGFAIGDSALSSYELSAYNSLLSRMTVYLSKDTGRLTNADYLAGRFAVNDIANATNAGGQDVFALKSLGNAYRQDFCFTSKPSTNTTFGLYSHIPNNFSFRVNPRVRPTIILKTDPKNDGKDYKVNCDDDAQALADTWKSKYHWSTRSALIGRASNTLCISFIDEDDSYNYVERQSNWNSFVANNGLTAFVLFIPNYTSDYVGMPTGFFVSDGGKGYRYLVGRNGPDRGDDYIRRINGELGPDVLSQASKIQLCVDNSGSMTRSTITADLDYFISQLTALGKTVIQYDSLSTENWIGPHLQTDIFGENADADLLIYHMSSQTDALKKIKFNQDNTDNKGRDADGISKCGDIGLGVSARQRSADDALEIGELYKIGSAVCILTGRSGTPDFTDPDKVFISQADSTSEAEGQDMYYKFKVVKYGNYGPLYSIADDINYNHGEHLVDGYKLIPPQWGSPGKRELADKSSLKKFNTATKAAQIFRCAIANVVTPRECQVFEIGLKSAVGIRVNGFSNLRDCPTLMNVNKNAGYKFQGNTYDVDTRLGVAIYQSGSIQTAELRYSFFKIYYRSLNGSFVEIPASFGVRSISSQSIFNYLRISMPSVNRWELRFEPLSGFEIRNGLAAEPLIVLDGRLKTEQSYGFASGISVYWTGTVVARSREVFRFRALEPDKDIAYGWSDDSDMTDDWGRLAEAFPYDEIQASTTNGPEHEIVYINTITQNTPGCTATYQDLALVGLNVQASTEWQQFSQFSAYVTGGIKVRRLLQSDSLGPSNLFPDILRDLLTSDRYGTGAAVSDSQIDTASFVRAANFCLSRRYFFDGTITQKTNLRQWAADTSAGMLLELVQRDGMWGLEPAVIFPGSGTTGKVPLKGLFTAGNIIENSFQLEFQEEQDRLPIQASVKWREERSRTNAYSNGLFPVEREVLVREAYRPDTDPIESFDLSDYCTNLEHAIDFACYVIRVRNLITHSIKFNTTADGLVTHIAAGDYIQVAMDVTYYDEYANGAVLQTGEMVTSRPELMTTGTHTVTAWAGGTAAVSDITLTVNADMTASPVGIMFMKKTTTAHLRTYKIESISISPEGVISVEAVHHPTDSSLKSELTKNWTTYVTDANWIIEAG